MEESYSDAYSGIYVNYTCTSTEEKDANGYLVYHFVNRAQDEEPEKPSKTITSGTVTVDVNGTGTTMVKIGETITYTISYTNNTNTEQTVTITDTLPTGLTYESSQVNSVDAAPVQNGQTLTWTIEKVQPFTSGSVTVTVTVTDAALTASGTVSNTAVVKIGNASEAKATSEVPVYNPALSVTKTASAPTSSEGYALGETITYTITVTNTGNVDLINVAVEDALVNKTGTYKLTYAGTLAPKASTTFTVTYTVTADDVAAGFVKNSVTATAVDSNNEEVTGTAEVTVNTREYGASNGFSITKTISDAGGSVTDEMNADTFSFTVYGPDDLYTSLNKGNTSGTATVEYKVYSGSGNTLTLEADGTAEVNSGTNSFTISGIKNGQTVIVTTALPTGSYTVEESPDNSSAVNTYTYTYEVTETSSKTSLTEGGSLEYTVTNTPETTSVTVTKSWLDGDGNELASSLIPASLTVRLSGTAGTGISLASYTGSYTLTTNNWSYTFTNLPKTNGDGETYTYTVSETVPDGFTATSGSSVTAEADLNGSGYTASLVNVKNDGSATQPSKELTSGTVTVTVDGAATTMVKVGDTLTYTITYTNNTNKKQTVTVTDTLPAGLTYASSQVNSVNAAPAQNGQTLTWTITDVAPFTGGIVTVTVTVTEDALTANTANPANPTLTNSASVQIGTLTAQSADSDPVPVENPLLKVEKTTASSPAYGTSYVIGEEITYTITVTNTGNVPVTDIVLTDEKTGDTFQIGTLQPGESSAEKTVTYTVTEADARTGSVTNTAAAAGKGPNSEDVTGSDSVEDEVRTYGAASGLTITKTISVASGSVTDEMNADKFSFTVYGPDDLYTSLNKGSTSGTVKVEYKVYSGSGSTLTLVTSGSAEVDSGTNSFTISGIQNGQTVIVTTALPTGSYTVTETAASGNTYSYTATINSGISGAGTASVTETLAKNSTVSYEAVNVPDTTTVTVTKVWEDDSDAYGLRQNSVTVYVKNGTETADTLTLSGSGNTWTATSKNLPKYDSAGDPITYTVVEEGVSGYYTSRTTTLYAGSYQITNTLNAGTLTVKKSVASPSAAIDTDTVFTVRVYGFSSESEGKTVTVAVENSDGSSADPQTRTVEEDTTTTSAATGTTVYYVEFTLLAGQTLTLSSLPAGSYTVVETEDNKPKYDWTVTYNDADGKGIYTVESAKTAAAVITNTITGTVVLDGTKTWNDGIPSHDNENEIVLSVSRQSEKPGSTADPLTEGTDYVVVWSGNDYKIYASSSTSGGVTTYTELAKYDSEGYLYTYTVSEDVNNSYAYTITSTTSTDGLTTDFTNTIQNPGKTVKVDNGGTYAAVGDTLTYTITYTNFSSIALGEFTIVDTLDSSVTYVADSAAVAYTAAGSANSLSVGSGTPTTLTWTIGGLAAGETVTVTFEVKVTSVPASGSVENTAKVNGFDTNKVTTPVSQITISGTKTWEDSEIDVSERPTKLPIYLRAVSNGSTKEIETQTDDPDGNYYIEWTNTGTDTWSYTISNVPKYDSNGYEITYTVVEEVPDGYTASSKTVAGKTDSDGNVTGANFTNTYHNPSKVVVQTSAAVGDVLTYTITYYNNSDDVLTSVEIIDYLSTDVSYVSSTVNGTDADPVITAGTNPTAVWNVDSLAPKEKVTIVLKVKVESVPDGGTLENYATVNGIRTDTASTSIDQIPLTVTKKWEDDDYTSLRPDSVMVSLLKDGTQVKDSSDTDVSATLTSNSWSGTFTGLSMSDAASYTVEETAVTGYTAAYVYTYTYQYTDADGVHTADTTDKDEAEKYTIIAIAAEITNTLDTTSLTVKKVWDDEENLYGLRPASVTAQLQYTYTANGVTYTYDYDGNGSLATLSADNTVAWTKTWEGLPEYLMIYGNAYPVTWSAVETTNLSSYTSSYEYTYTWMDGNELRTAAATADELAALQVDYTITKVEVTNTLNAGSLSVKKSVASPDTDTSAASFTIRIYSIGFARAAGGTEVAAVLTTAGSTASETKKSTVSSDTQGYYVEYTIKADQTITISGLPAGSYTVVESGTTGGYSWTTAYSENTGADKGVYSVTGGGTAQAVVTNTITDTVTLTGDKTWVEPESTATNHDNAEELVLLVYRASTGTGSTSTLVSSTEYTVTWSGSDYTISGLDKYDSYGYKYSYTVEETYSAAYSGNYGNYTDDASTTDTDSNGYTIYHFVNSAPDETAADPTKELTDGTVTVDVDGTSTTMVKVGATVTYTISYRNHTNTAQTVTVTDTLPTGLTYSSSQINGVDAAPVQSGQKLTWPISDVAPFTSGTVTVTVTVEAAALAAGETVSNTATVKIGNGSATDAPSTVPIYDAELSVTKTASAPANGDSYALGETITYTIKVTNTGNVDLDSVAVEDALVKKTGSNKLTWSGTLTPGDSATFPVEYTVTADDVAAGFVTNTVTATAKDSNNEEVTGTAEVTVDTREYGASEGLSITKTISVASGSVTDEMNADTFSFTVTGPADLYTSLNGGSGTADVTIYYTVSSAGGSNSEVKSTTLASGTNSFIISGIKNGQTVTVTTALPTGEYKVTETSASGNNYSYTASIQGGSAGSTAAASATETLTKNGTVSYKATNVPDTATVTVTKEWADDNDAYGLRPGEVTVNVYVKDSSTRVDTLTLSGSNSWTATSKNLPKYDSNGKEIVYTAVEASLDDYTASYQYTYSYDDNGDIKTGTATEAQLADLTVDYTITAVAITNTLDTGSLAITKSVVSPDTNTSDATFTVQVYSAEFAKVAAAARIAATVTDAGGTNPVTRDSYVLPGTDPSGNASYYVLYTIKAGQTLTLSGLPEGSYTVVESGATGSYNWTTTYSGSGNSGTDYGVYTVKADDPAAATITNTITGTASVYIAALSQS
ncbi:MAG: Cna B-type domain-containing protein [Clostridiales bacterium]|nr:Cna B-type domain-containing protein [Clostridiales bacterium]